MKPLTSNDAAFLAVCSAVFDRTTKALPPAIAGSLLHSRLPVHNDWAPTELWFAIYGRKTGAHKFWDAVVSNYFIVKSITRNEWRVGIHYSPGQQGRCSGHIFGADMRALLQPLDGKEGYQFKHWISQKDTDKLCVEQAMRPPEADLETLLAPKLQWLIEATWPGIQKSIAAHQA